MSSMLELSVEVDTKTGHFRNDILSRSFGLALKKLSLTQGNQRHRYYIKKQEAFEKCWAHSPQ